MKHNNSTRSGTIGDPGRTMERYIEIASQYGLQGENALKFASERMDKDIEREERRHKSVKRNGKNVKGYGKGNENMN